MKNFSRVAAGLSNILKNSTKKKFRGIKFILTDKAFELFNELKYFFIYTFILVYYNLICYIMLEYNIFGFAISVVLSKLIKKTNQWYFIAFCLYKIILMEWNYKAKKLKRLVIIKDFKHKKYYIKDDIYNIWVITDYINLHIFLTTKNF